MSVGNDTMFKDGQNKTNLPEKLIYNKSFLLITPTKENGTTILCLIMYFSRYIIYIARYVIQ